MTVLTDVSESSYLADVLGGPASRALLLPTDAGLLVVGGLEIGESDELASVFDEAAVVHEDGSVAVPAPVPGGPVANLAGSAGDGRAYVAGTRCNSGTMGADDGSLACEPGEPVLLHLDLATLTWTELSLPAEAPAPAGFLGDQQVYALADDTLVYTVEAADGGAAEGWVSTDGGREWERIAEAPGWSCAAQGRLLAIDDRTERPAAPEEGESEATITSDEVDATLHLAVSIYDPAANRWGEPDDDAPQLSVVAGATSISCAPEQGVVAFVLTGGRAGAIIGYSPDGPDGGWSTREDPRGSRFMELLRSTDGLLLPQMGTEDLVRLEGGLGAEAETVPLPEGSTPIAGIGRSVLVVDGGVPRLEK
ncbi:MAG TPA: hypothetical protein VEW93_02470 [Acidimicrobiales bacterium]|nr:hypothetical protein [Acidimicrobiales bacterium]